MKKLEISLALAGTHGSPRGDFAGCLVGWWQLRLRVTVGAEETVTGFFTG